MLKEPSKDDRRYRVTYSGSEVVRVGGGKFMNGTVAFLDEAGAREAAGMEGFEVEGLDGAPAAASTPPAQAQQSAPPVKAEEKKAEAKPEEKKAEEKKAEAKPEEKKAEAKAEEKKAEAKPPGDEKKADKSDKPAEAPKA